MFSMKYKVISIFILFILIFQTVSLGTSIYVWSDNENGTTEVNAETAADNFLNIESESAILIEQTTRTNTL